MATRTQVVTSLFGRGRSFSLQMRPPALQPRQLARACVSLGWCARQPTLEHIVSVITFLLDACGHIRSAGSKSASEQAPRHVCMVNVNVAMMSHCQPNGRAWA